jgi:peptide subunit release factor 1 (eRF1)
MLADEFGTASNIKSRVNRQSVLGAITSCQQRLKLYNRVSRNQPRTCTAATTFQVGHLRTIRSSAGGSMHMKAPDGGGWRAL